MKHHPLEKDLENEALELLNSLGIFAWKNQSTGIFDPKLGHYRASNNPFHIKGTSDILGIIERPDSTGEIHGVMLAIEMKRPLVNGKPRTQEQLYKMASEEQRAFIKKIQRSGGVAFFADSLTTIEQYLELHRYRVGVK